MDTLVWERDKSADAWPRFERGEISEEEFAAAESLGIHAIRFESADQLREALKPCFPELS